jgi:hypothetical protein
MGQNTIKRLEELNLDENEEERKVEKVEVKPT